VPLPIVDFYGINLVLFGLDLATSYGLYLAISVSLNLEFGYAGLANFGKMFYIAAGATIGGSFGGRFAAWMLNMSSGPFIGTTNFAFIGQVNVALMNKPGIALAILFSSLSVAGVTGALMGLATSYIVKRLRADYLAMALFSLAQVYTIVLNDYSPIVGGPLGVELPNVYEWAGAYSEVIAGAALIIFALVVYVVVERMVRSPLGRALRAIRDDEVAAESLGKNTIAMGRKAFIIASAISGMAGCLYVFYTLDVYSQTFIYTSWTVEPFLMTVLGGTANNVGVALGVLLYLLIISITNIGQFSFQNVLPFSVTWLQYWIIAGVLLLVLFVRPQGLIPEKSTHTIGKKKMRRIYHKFRPETKEAAE
jgi:branched-chain amino acid transport system permease protein